MLDGWVERNLGKRGAGSRPGKQQRRDQKAAHRQEGKYRCRLAYRGVGASQTVLPIFGSRDGPVLDLVFFAERLGGSEPRFLAVRGTAVLLVHQLPQKPDLFTAQEAKHRIFLGPILLARF